MNDEQTQQVAMAVECRGPDGERYLLRGRTWDPSSEAYVGIPVGFRVWAIPREEDGSTGPASWASFGIHQSYIAVHGREDTPEAWTRRAARAGLAIARTMLEHGKPVWSEGIIPLTEGENVSLLRACHWRECEYAREAGTNRHCVIAGHPVPATRAQCEGCSWPEDWARCVHAKNPYVLQVDQPEVVHIVRASCDLGKGHDATKCREGTMPCFEPQWTHGFEPSVIESTGKPREDDLPLLQALTDVNRAWADTFGQPIRSSMLFRPSPADLCTVGDATPCAGEHAFRTRVRALSDIIGWTYDAQAIHAAVSSRRADPPPRQHTLRALVLYLADSGANAAAAQVTQLQRLYSLRGFVAHSEHTEAARVGVSVLWDEFRARLPLTENNARTVWDAVRQRFCRILRALAQALHADWEALHP